MERNYNVNRKNDVIALRSIIARLQAVSDNWEKLGAVDNTYVPIDVSYVSGVQNLDVDTSEGLCTIMRVSWYTPNTGKIMSDIIDDWIAEHNPGGTSTYFVDDMEEYQAANLFRNKKRLKACNFIKDRLQSKLDQIKGL